MPRKKKTETIQPVEFNEVMIQLARDTIAGKYGDGITRKHNLNSLGYGNIYPTVQKYVIMIVTGKI